MLVDKALVEASLNSPHSRASFLAASSQHSGDWLFALPIVSCGLKLDDEAVRVAVGLRLDLFANSDVYVKLYADDIKLYLDIISDSDQHTLQRSLQNFRLVQNLATETIANNKCQHNRISLSMALPCIN